MSRTLKDAPAARKARTERRFAERETPLDYQPAAAVSWEELAEAAQTDGHRAQQLITLFASDAEIQVRAELTAYANGF